MLLINGKFVREEAEINFKRLDKVTILDNKESVELKEEEFLSHEFNEISFDSLNLDLGLTNVLESRLREIKECLKFDSPLAVIFLCGSTLEGILLGIALKQPKNFNMAKSAPKDKEGKVKKLHEWTLNNLINVSYEIGLLKKDVKKFSHSLRDFRNFIHPFEQMSSNFYPDKQTAKISWQVLKAAICQLGNV